MFPEFPFYLRKKKRKAKEKEKYSIINYSKNL